VGNAELVETVNSLNCNSSSAQISASWFSADGSVNHFNRQQSNDVYLGDLLNDTVSIEDQPVLAIKMHVKCAAKSNFPEEKTYGIVLLKENIHDTKETTSGSFPTDPDTRSCSSVRRSLQSSQCSLPRDDISSDMPER
jgi:hypothetical protein